MDMPHVPNLDFQRLKMKIKETSIEKNKTSDSKSKSKRRASTGGVESVGSGSKKNKRNFKIDLSEQNIRARIKKMGKDPPPYPL